MVDPILITTLITVIITGITQFAQMYFDFKAAEKQGHSEVFKIYETNCCSSVKDCSDKEEDHD